MELVIPNTKFGMMNIRIEFKNKMHKKRIKVMKNLTNKTKKIIILNKERKLVKPDFAPFKNNIKECYKLNKRME